MFYTAKQGVCRAEGKPSVEAMADDYATGESWRHSYASLLCLKTKPVHSLFASFPQYRNQKRSEKSYLYKTYRNT